MLELAERVTLELDGRLDVELRNRALRHPQLVQRDVRRDREHPRAQVAAVLEASVRAQRAEKRLLPGILGLGAEEPPEVPEYLVAMRDVEALERRDLRHGHRPHDRENVAGSGIVRCAVVGHVEWVEFARVPRMPSAGEIVHADRVWEEPAGGGAVVARQLALLAGRCELFTALGADSLGRRSAARLAELGIDVHVKWGGTTRRAWTHVDGAGERTITVLGDKLLPDAPLPLDGYDLVFFVAGTCEALASARRARFLAATVRELPTLQHADVELDLLVASANDPGERYDGSTKLEVRHVALTDGVSGGTLDGEPYAPEPVASIADTYGAGDSFAAALAFGLARGDDPRSAAALAARAGAAVIGGAGPYEAQLALRR
jgi:ribokinase